MTRSEVEAEMAEKVRKLLRLGKSTNEHEAALAVEHALRLAEKYKIDLEALALDPEIEKIIDRRFPCGRRLSYVAKLALNICTGFFHVTVVLSKPDAVFIGTPSDVAIAYYIFGFVTGACNRCLRIFEAGMRRKPTLNKRRNFIAGFFYGLRNHLSSNGKTLTLESSKLAIILADQRTRRLTYKDRLFPRTTSVNQPKMRRNLSALTCGFIAGEETVINQPLNGTQPIFRLT